MNHFTTVLKDLTWKRNNLIECPEAYNEYTRAINTLAKIENPHAISQQELVVPETKQTLAHVGTYILGPVEYIEDDMLYQVRMAVRMKTMPLHYTVHGKTSGECMDRAVWLANLLTKNKQL